MFCTLCCFNSSKLDNEILAKQQLSNDFRSLLNSNVNTPKISEDIVKAWLYKCYYDNKNNVKEVVIHLPKKVHIITRENNGEQLTTKIVEREEGFYPFTTADRLEKVLDTITESLRNN